MCVTCGCGDTKALRIEAGDGSHEHVLAGGSVVRHSHGHHDNAHVHGHDHDHHPHDNGHTHSHAAYRKDAPAELVALEAALLGKNQAIAERNRERFKQAGVLTLNMMSSPGSGKTSLLVRTLQDLAGEMPMAVVEGDQETSADAQRIRATGAAAVQINTGTGCHLEADMLARAFDNLAPPRGGVLFVENVGNLVCPALFDLGERARVVVLSVTEGEDKPLKYPHMFRSAQLMVTTKMDLAPHVDFDVAAAERHARSVNPTLQCLRVSSRSGEGMTQWYGWLRAMQRIEALR
jgi:hydrogenase nickel incorporation protein HypB